MKKHFLSLVRNVFWKRKPNPEKFLLIAKNRLIIIGIFSILCFSGITAKAFILSTQNNLNTLQTNQNHVISQRGEIIDRNGRVLAQNIPIIKLYANPQEVMDKNKAAIKLSKYLNKPQDEILNLLNKKTKYVELERKLTPKKHSKILELGIPGIKFLPANLRFYPHGNEAAHVLGKIDIDGNGIAGVEKSFNEHLVKGDTLTLSIDINIQAILRTEIEKQINKFKANSGAGIILDVKTGELLSLVSLPDYNNNKFSQAKPKQQFNNATKGLFEMGSVFKVLNVAIGLEAGATFLSSKYNVSKPIKISKFKIRDDHQYKNYLNTSEVLVLSSNIGSARIAEEIGIETQKSYFKTLGLLDYPQTKLPEITIPKQPKNWKKTELMTISYGYGIAVSALHAASAISAASSYGFFINPKIKKIISDDEIRKIKIFSNDTVTKIRTMMRLVVSHEDGTANFAETPGYLVGAKTGTAEKVGVGGYNKKANVVSLVSLFPMHLPQYLIFIVIDHPKKIRNVPRTTAGHVIAPAIPKIVNQIAPILGVQPIDKNSTKIRQNFNTNIQIQNKGVTLVSY